MWINVITDFFTVNRINDGRRLIEKDERQGRTHARMDTHAPACHV